MVSSVSSFTPTSYLNQLLGASSATASSPATTTTAPATAVDPSSTAATTSGALGLPAAVVTLLQSIGGNSTITSLLGDGTNSAAGSGSLTLVGDPSQVSASEYLASQDSNVLQTAASSGLYKAALSATKDQDKDAATGSAANFMNNVLASYNNALAISKPPVPNTVSTTS